jgi:hypothetical protein
MTAAREERPGPIEAWLSKPNIEVTCRIVREDETATEIDVTSLSMRGAQREITAWLIGLGYAPAGRWEAEEQTEDAFPGPNPPPGTPGHFHQDTLECVRKFRPEKVTEPV